MPLKATCSSCGKTFGVPDRFAGKRFKCKNCGEPVQAPELESDDDLFGDMDFGAGESVEPELPVKPRKSGKGKKKSRKAKQGGGVGRIAIIAGATIAGLFAVMVLVGVVAKLGPALASLSVPAKWQEYTTPDGKVTMQMPGTVKPVKVAAAAPGASSLGVETRQYACIVVIEPIPAQVSGLTDDEIMDALATGLRMTPGIQNFGGETVAGKDGVAFDRKVGAIQSEAKAVKWGDKFYTFTYAHKGSPNAEVRDKFFSSIRLN